MVIGIELYILIKFSLSTSLNPHQMKYTRTQDTLSQLICENVNVRINLKDLKRCQEIEFILFTWEISDFKHSESDMELALCSSGMCDKTQSTNHLTK